MDNEKIGQFICSLRKEQNMTQQELADKLGVSDRAISNYENGRRLPDYSLVEDLCSILSISVNELLAGERLSDEDFKRKADENLMEALENSTFSLHEKVTFFKNKWLSDHQSTMMATGVLWIIIMVICYFYIHLTFVGMMLVTIIFGLASYIVLYNQMMIYVEANAYRNV